MDKFDEQALAYHRDKPAGKIAVVPSKPLANQRDLALAYSPGVAAACRAIVDNPLEASHVTARANLVGVISNGTAVLGLGDIGALASKPVMEGKGVLFKKFAGIDVFDIEINEKDPDKLVDIIASLEPTFGGINLEDIKAPECFVVESKLKEKLKIPVFHDDQHGTAIIVAAAVLNGLDIVNKNIADIRIVTLGAGAAAQGCLKVLKSMGLPKENIMLVDRQGVIYTGRPGLNCPYKQKFAVNTTCRTLADALRGADIFLGLSGPGIVTAEMIRTMATSPMVFALANPVPEIMPELVKQVRPDALVATGRSDFPNQVNNVLCFPYIFRGALDVGATEINDAMKIACARAIADLARQGASDVVMRAYEDSSFQFGPDYLIPRPFDPRLSVEVSLAAAKAAMESGVASSPIKDLTEYRQQLSQMVFRSGLFMKPFFDRARIRPKRVVYSEAENEVVLRAVQDVVDEKIAVPVLVGDEHVIERKIKELGLHIHSAKDFHVIAPEKNEDGNATAAFSQLNSGTVDALICGTRGGQEGLMRQAVELIGLRRNVKRLAFLKILLLHQGAFFIASALESEPNAEQLVETALMAADAVKHMGVTPRLALLSHSSKGSSHSAAARRVREATVLLEKTKPDFEFDGEIQADTALLTSLRKKRLPNSRLAGNANVLIMPSRDASNIAFNMVKVLGEGIAVGPVLLGINKPVFVVSSSATVRRIVNMTALAVAQAQDIECDETGNCIPE